MEQKPDLSSAEARAMGRKLQAVRNAAQLDQQTLADICDLKKSTIIAMELGKYNFGIRQLTQVARALGYRVTLEPIATPTDR